MILTVLIRFCLNASYSNDDYALMIICDVLLIIILVIIIVLMDRSLDTLLRMYCAAKACCKVKVPKLADICFR